MTPVSPPTADASMASTPHGPPSEELPTTSSDPEQRESTSADEDTTSFGDLLAQLLRTLPEDASSRFLMALSGLSATESYELCAYVSKLRDEKQFRVIRAMAESTIEGKKKFLGNLRHKIAQQEEKQRELESQAAREEEENAKRKLALHAAARVKMLNSGANKYHSFNAAVGANENIAGHSNGVTPPTVGGKHPARSAATKLPTTHEHTAPRSMSSSCIVTTDDIKQVGKLLTEAHITDSEQNLRLLEISKKGFASIGTQKSAEHMEVESSKRDRSSSSRQLLQAEKQVQKRKETMEDDGGKPLGKAPSASSSTSSSCSSPQLPKGASEAAGTTNNGESENPPAPEDPEAPTSKRWTKAQDAALRESVRLHGEKNWKAIAEMVPGRNHAQCLQRWRKVLKPGLVKGHWSFEEDQILEYLVAQQCHNWGQIAERIPGRTPKQCRERWKNHLDPAINKGPYTEEEDKVILEAQARLGNKWSQIAQLLKGRTEDSVKIRWKSLKQNPAKATASYAQHKKNLEQHQAQQQYAGPQASMYPTNPAVLRQRQLQMLQHQQLHQNKTAQMLEQQQQLQQQQLQLRLQEKAFMQQLQHHAQPHLMNGAGTPIKSEPFAAGLPRSLPSPTVSAPMHSLSMSPSSSIHMGNLNRGSSQDQMQGVFPPSNECPANLSSGSNMSMMFNKQIHSGQVVSNGVDHHSYGQNMSSNRFAESHSLPPPSSLGYASPSHFMPLVPPRQHSASQDDLGASTSSQGTTSTPSPPRPIGSHDQSDDGGPWDLSGSAALSDSLGMHSRIGENPPPASFWLNHSKHTAPEALANLFHDSNGHARDGSGPSGLDYEDDAVFESLANELGNSNALSFTPL